MTIYVKKKHGQEKSIIFTSKKDHLAKWYGMVETSLGPASETEHRCSFLKMKTSETLVNGGPGRTRTSDQWIMSPLLLMDWAVNHLFRYQNIASFLQKLM